MAHEAEKAVVGGIILEPSTATKFTPLLVPGDFSDRSLGEFWRIICNATAAGHNIDLVTLTSLGVPANQIQDLAAGADGAPLPFYIDIVRQASRRRSVRRLLSRAIEEINRGEAPVVALDTLRRNAEPALREARTIKPINGADLHKMDIADRPWLVDSFVARREITLVSSPPGEGKTTFLQDLALACCRGESFWAGFRLTGEPIKVLYLDPENSVSLLKASVLSNARATEAALKKIWLLAETLVFIDTPEGMTTFKFLVEDVKPDLVIIDTLRAHALTMEENKATGIDGVRPIFSFLRSVAQAGDCGMIVAHHMNKAGEKNRASDSGVGVSGNSDIRGAADMSFMYRRDREDEGSPSRIVPDKVRGMGVFPSAVFLTLLRDDDGLWKFEQSEKVDARRNKAPIVREILGDMIARGERIVVADVARSAKCDRQVVRRAMREMGISESTPLAPAATAAERAVQGDLGGVDGPEF